MKRTGPRPGKETTAMRIAIRIFLIAALLHIGITALSPLVLNRFLKGKIREIVHDSTNRSEEFVRGEILDYAQEKKIPLSPGDVKVWRHRGDIRIWIEYDQVIAIPFHDHEIQYLVAYPAGIDPPPKALHRNRSTPRR